MSTNTRCWPDNATQRAINLVTTKYGREGLRGFLTHVHEDGQSGCEWLTNDPEGLLAKLKSQPKTPLEETEELVEHLRSLEFEQKGAEHEW